MEEADLLLTHGLIVTQDDERTLIEDGAIAIRADRIVALGPSAELLPRFAAR